MEPDIHFDSAGNFLSKGDVVIRIFNDEIGTKVSTGIFESIDEDETLTLRKPVTVLLEDTQLTYVVKSSFTEMFIHDILKLLSEILIALDKPKPNLKQFRQRIDEIVNRQDLPDE